MLGDAKVPPHELIGGMSKKKPGCPPPHTVDVIDRHGCHCSVHRERHITHALALIHMSFTSSSFRLCSV